MFGFVGLLVAVPLAATIGVLAALLAQGVVARRTAPKVIPMSELVGLVKDGKVAEAHSIWAHAIDDLGEISEYCALRYLFVELIPTICPH